jgi:hypothetical protein
MFWTVLWSAMVQHRFLCFLDFLCRWKRKCFRRRKPKEIQSDAGPSHSKEDSRLVTGETLSRVP